MEDGSFKPLPDQVSSTSAQFAIHNSDQGAHLRADAGRDYSGRMFFRLMGTIVIAGIVGYVSERSGFTRNGILASIIICIGGAFLFFFVRVMFGLHFGSPGLDAVISSVGALIIVPTHWRR